MTTGKWLVALTCALRVSDACPASVLRMCCPAMIPSLLMGTLLVLEAHNGASRADDETLSGSRVRAAALLRLAPALAKALQGE